jgi:hypothetical protein
MRRSAALTCLTAVTASVLALAGCSSGGGGDDGAASTTQPAPSRSPSAQERYLAAAHGLSFLGSLPHDAELLAYPPKWCAGLRAGRDPAALFSPDSPLYPRGTAWGLQQADAHRLLAAGVASYCPQFGGKVAALPADGGATASATATAPAKLRGQCRFLSLDEVARATGTRPYDATESMGFCLYLAGTASTVVSVGFHQNATDIGSGETVSGLGGQARWDADQRILNVRTHGGVLSLSVAADGVPDARATAASLVRTVERRLP